MKKLFDFVIGNPPFQESRTTTKDMPVYNYFMDGAESVSSHSLLITPGRFLFDAGATPKAWNKKKLHDKHFKILSYNPKSETIFPSTDIKGGVVISYQSDLGNYGEIGTFTPFEELNLILRKVNNKSISTMRMDSIMVPYSAYNFSNELWNDFPEKKKEIEYISKNRNSLSKEEKDGKLSNIRIITTNIFELFPEIFFDSIPDSQEYVQLVGRKKGERCKKYVLKKYINVGCNYSKWKVIVPKSNGSGALGETLSTPMLGTPMLGYTQTFLGIGSFETKAEAEACMKYVKTKFARTMLGVLKRTQDNPPEKWKYVPLQNFTSNSDIDWSKSVAEIDQRLYKKYWLDEKEIDFIESHVKEMN